MKHFLNQPERLVQEAIEGLIAGSGGRLTRLDGFPDIKVVLRSCWDGAKVALVSGGGSGHEPAHAGFVGQGMLTAAVAGEIFASPSVEAVLAAILAVTGAAGCLLIVKNYTGDRLNFGLAAEQARALGLRVETVLVADDVALPQAEQPRGLAGTLLVHKIAGALAQNGASLEDVAATARRVAGSTLSLGLALNSCSPPGHPGRQRLGAEEAELGLGIHGEPGAEKIPMASADQLVNRLLEKLPNSLPDSALLINNLGGVPPLEMGVLTRALLNSRLADCVQLLIGPAPLMTSYDMNGFSISLLPLDDELRQALLAPTQATAWPLAYPPHRAQPLPLPGALSPRLFQPSSDARLAQTLLTICQVLEEGEADLNALDAKVGDGDTGSTLARAARAVAHTVRSESLPLQQPAQLLQALSQTLARAMGGSSGVLLCIFLSAASEGLAVGQAWAPAFRLGLQRMQEYGGAQPGDRTAVDALQPALQALLDQGLTLAARAARQGANSTATMQQARAGRSAYVPSHSLAGVVDPGAEAVARVFEGLARA